MNLHQPFILAQTSLPSSAPTTTVSMSSAPATPAPTPPPWWAQPSQQLPILLMIMDAVMMIMGTKSKRKQDKQLTDLLGNLKRGDKVQTIGGIIGTVVEARENDVLLKVDETNNTKIKFARKAIHRVLVDEAPADSKS